MKLKFIQKPKFLPIDPMAAIYYSGPIDDETLCAY